MKRIRGTDPHIVAHVVGNDIVIRNVLCTAFGYNDPGDNGETESGTRNGPDVMGCALPVKANEAATRPSPIAFAHPIPWGTLVEFTDVSNPNVRVIVPLIDNGPDVRKYPDHAADLCVAPAHVFQPNIPLDKLATRFEHSVNIRILGGAAFVPPSLIVEDGEDDGNGPPGNVQRLCTAFMGVISRWWNNNTGKESPA